MLEALSKITLSDALLQLLAPLLGVLFLWWKGGFGWTKEAILRLLSLRRYQRVLRADISSLPIIGKKEGFDLTKVYVDVRIAPSDLVNKPEKHNLYPRSSYVLVGAPGAGKSTYVKNALLRSLKESPNRPPLFLRLRDFDRSHKIETLIAKRMEAQGIRNSEALVLAELRKGCVLCVLDGLDEVRPHLLEDAYESINAFYTAYFNDSVPGRLIVSSRKEAYRPLPLAIPAIWEILPLSDNQVQQFAKAWPLQYPHGRSPEEFWNDLSASEKILEVSRSPLLLVGSLLLYTESGLGIPGQKIKYLEKIKQTLIEDWAIAQGQPPDPLREAYSPALTAIAYEMHCRAVPELPRNDCLQLLAGIMPGLGQEAGSAPEFLDSLIKRTGILVRDIPGFVVFVQFTLQEYFASLALVAQVPPNEIAALEPKAWWRETILFVAAQKTDASELIRNLFVNSPMLGALAVAETPTPSLSLQGEAIRLSLNHLDASDKQATPALTSLLRKVSKSVAAVLAAELEERLKPGSNLAEQASQILAAANTDLSTEALSRHPASWQGCIKNPTLMSGRFESKLISWVQTAEHAHWTEAAELVVQLPTMQSPQQLTATLKCLPAGRAERLAIMLLRELRSHEGRGQGWHTSDPVNFANVCTALRYIENVDHAIFEVNNNNSRSRNHDPERAFGGSGVVNTALSLARQNGWKEAAAEEKTFRAINDSLIWCQYGTPFLRFLLSTLAIIGTTLLGHIGAIAALLIASAGLVFLSARPATPAPWLGNYGSMYRPELAAQFAVTLALGATVAASLYSSFDALRSPNAPTFELALFSTLSLALAAALFFSNSRLGRSHPLFPPPLNKRWLVELRWISLGWVAAIAVIIVMRTQLNPTGLEGLTVAISAALSLWAAHRIGRMLAAKRRVDRALAMLSLVTTSA